MEEFVVLSSIIHNIFDSFLMLKCLNGMDEILRLLWVTTDEVFGSFCFMI